MDPRCYLLAPSTVAEEPRRHKRVKHTNNNPVVSMDTEFVGEEAISDSVPMAYNLRNIGGNYTEIRALHELRDVWDSEIVLEIIQWGGVPPLHSISSFVQREHYREARCNFIQPNGTLIRDIKLPVSALRNYKKFLK